MESEGYQGPTKELGDNVDMEREELLMQPASLVWRMRPLSDEGATLEHVADLNMSEGRE